MTLEQIYTVFLESSGVSTDTRSLIVNNLFFALKGPNFNGNLYAEKAITSGASYAIVDEQITLKDTEYTSRLIVVDDVLATLQELSTFHRRQLGTTIIGITGSNGKTTTKELLASILSRRYHIQYTQGNLNNHIGVPLTLLSISKDHDIAIVEMGANHLNDIKELCEIAEPDYGYITNIGDAHLEGFGSREGVLYAKSQLFVWVTDIGNICFVNQFDQAIKSLPIPEDKVKYLHSDIKILPVEDSLKLAFEYNGSLVQSQLTGHYNIENINASITIAEYFKVSTEDIVTGINSYTPSNNRSQITSYKGATIIMDAYNANPSSMMKSIDNILHINSNKKMVILGEMLELGAYQEQKHDEVLEKVANSDLTQVVTVGDMFAHAVAKLINPQRVISFSDTESCKEWLAHQTLAGYTILIKGSRGNKLESLLV